MPKEVKQATLLDYIEMPEDFSDVQTWYFQKTGGNQSRLQIGYRLARELDRLIDRNRFVGCLKPDDIVIQPVGPSLKMGFVKGLRYNYGNMPPEYTDPLVLSGRRLMSAASEIYSFAVILFQMLTLCHPFKGEAYESCSAEEAAEKWKNGQFDYIGDYSRDNTNDEFEYNTHLHLTSELSGLFSRMFVSGKMDEDRRPSLKEIAGACLRAVRLSLFCEHGSYSVGYYGEDSFICPYCRKENKPVAVITSWKRFFSSRPVMMPDSLKGNPEPAATDRKQLNKMYLYKTDGKVTRSLFEDDVRYEADSTCLEVGIHKSIVVVNRLKNLYITIDRNEIAPGVKYMSSSKADSIVVSLPPDMYLNQDGEDLLNLTDPVYGMVKVRYYLTIEKGDRL